MKFFHIPLIQDWTLELAELIYKMEWRTCTGWTRRKPWSIRRLSILREKSRCATSKNCLLWLLWHIIMEVEVRWFTNIYDYQYYPENLKPNIYWKQNSDINSRLIWVGVFLKHFFLSDYSDVSQLVHWRGEPEQWKENKFHSYACKCCNLWVVLVRLMAGRQTG